MTQSDVFIFCYLNERIAGFLELPIEEKIYILLGENKETIAISADDVLAGDIIRETRATILVIQMSPCRLHFSIVAVCSLLLCNICHVK